FVSSRRRHTRSKRDWSSDVCSSDLGTSQSTSGSLAVTGHCTAAVVSPPARAAAKIVGTCSSLLSQNHSGRRAHGWNWVLLYTPLVAGGHPVICAAWFG